MNEPDAFYEHRACDVCGAITDDEAAKRCKLSSDLSGERWCSGGAEEESYPDGRLRFKSDAYFKAQDAWVDQEINHLKARGEWP